MSLDITLVHDGETVWEGNITHNLAEMADRAGMYSAMWRPDELSYTPRGALEDVRAGINLMLGDRKRFERLNPTNGWGNFDTLLEFACEYARALSRWPYATVKVSR